jgi:hypothetical protein
MKHKLFRPLAAGVAAVVAAGVAVLAAPVAQAANTLTITPATGDSGTPLAAAANADCPANTEGYTIQIEGAALPTGPDTIFVNGYAPYSGGTVSVPLSKTLNDIRQDAGLATLPTGSYTLTLVCRTAFDPTPLASFTGVINVTTAMTTSAVGAYAVPAPATAATVALAASPTSVTAGGSSTVTATITPANAAGSVQFSIGGVAQGAPVAVSGGTASKQFTNLTASTTVTAKFTSSNTSIALDSTVDGSTTISVGKVATSVALVASPNPAFASSNVSLTATVSPSSVAGSVVFSGFPGGPSAPVAVVNGVATLPVGQLAAGSYSLSAAFTPANPAVADPSTGTASLSVADKNPAQIATEYIRTTVADGALTITVKGYPLGQSPALPDGPGAGEGPADVTYPYTVGAQATNVVYLPDALLNSTGTFIETTGNIIPVVVSDTRAGDLGYTVTGSITDLSTSGGEIINGQNVGWAPYFLASNRWGGTPGNRPAEIVEGPVVAPAAGVAPAEAGDAGIKGTPETLFSIAAGKSSGTVEYGAALSVKAPTYTKPGQYQGVLTVSVNALP